MLQINNFKVRLYDCINEHDIDEISLEEFEDTQKIDESKIICQYCGNMNKCNCYIDIPAGTNICVGDTVKIRRMRYR